MDYGKLLKDVDEAGGFGDRAHARDAAEAVLSVLGEHLVGGASVHLAAQLPPELAVALPPAGGAEAFGVEDFDRRVADREGRGCSPAAAHDHTVAVMTTVLEAVTPGKARKVAAQLPADFHDFVPASVER